MKILKIMLLGLLLGTASASAQVEGRVMKAAHEVQMGETLYSISKKYNVSVEDLQKANPKMGETLLAGSVIFIPDVVDSEAKAREEALRQMQHVTDGPGMVKETIPCKTMYQVEKKETVFSIARQFHITEEELLRANPQIVDNKVKKGEYLCIPYSATEVYEMKRESEDYANRQREREAAEARAAEEAAKKAKMLEKINVAVILPFNLDAEKKTKEAVKMYDFYEGFLLAVDELKSKGISVDIHAYEEPSVLSNGIDVLLARPEMQNMNLIVGPMRLENIPSLSRFAQQHNIPLAIPFTTKASITASSSTCYQINTNISRFYKDISKSFSEKYQDCNIIIVNTGDRGEKADYAGELKQALNDNNIAFQLANADDLSTLSKIATTDRKVVIAPVSNAQNAFEKIVNRLGQNNDIDSYSIEMFGFPEWQAFSDKNKINMRKYHASFFCTFYADPSSTQVQEFNRLFKYWFKRDQTATYPQYGLLGYDTGKYFITGLNQFGVDFMNNSSELRVPALQNPMQFRRNDNNGFINTYYRIVSF